LHVKDKWAAEEMKLRLARLDEALADEVAARKKDLYFYNEWVALKRYFGFPFKDRKCKDLAGCREVRKLIGAWWEKNKGRLRWNRKTRKFVGRR